MLKRAGRSELTRVRVEPLPIVKEDIAEPVPAFGKVRTQVHDALPGGESFGRRSQEGIARPQQGVEVGAVPLGEPGPERKGSVGSTPGAGDGGPILGVGQLEPGQGERRVESGGRLEVTDRVTVGAPPIGLTAGEVGL